MKKWITTALASVCAVSACVGFAACETPSKELPSKELQLDKEYVFSSLSFKKAADITMDDIDSFIPFGYTDKIKSIRDFEKFLTENVETYYIYQSTENGTKRVDLKPTIESIRITKGFAVMEDGYSVWIVYEDTEEEKCFGATREGDVFTFINHPDQGCYFKSGALHYEQEWNEKFSVVYTYKIQ